MTILSLSAISWAAGCTANAGSNSTSGNSNTAGNPLPPDPEPACVTGETCDDGDRCTEADTCVDEACLGTAIAGCRVCTSALDCADNNLCTDDTCDSGVCVTAFNTLPCTDADGCTTDERCDEGICVGVPLPGCISCQESGDCDDGNPCTDDGCVGPVCVTEPCPSSVCVHDFNDEPCNDGDPLTLADVCRDGVCEGVLAPSEAPCESAAECADGNLCTNDVCGEEGCEHPFNTAVCDDGDLCTGSDVCTAGTCGGTAITGCQTCTTVSECDDDNECTTDACDDGICTHTAVAGCVSCEVDGDCTDQVACTDDRCVSGSCVFTATNTLCPDDGTFCNGTESCNASLGCLSSGSSCTVGQFCNEALNACVECLDATVCDDGNACTDDVCDAVGSCQNPQVADDVTVSINITGDGAVQVDPPCGAWPVGTQVTLIAIPQGCSTFDRWEGDLTGGNAVQTLTLDTNKTVTAFFDEDPPNLAGEWTLTRTLSSTDTTGGANTLCLFSAEGSQDSITVTISQTDDQVTVHFETLLDNEPNDLADDSPGQNWLLFEPDFCPVGGGQPYSFDAAGTLNVASLNASFFDFPSYCNCNWDSNGIMVANLTDCVLSGFLYLSLERTCSAGQQIDEQCGEEYSFSGTRN